MARENEDWTAEIEYSKQAVAFINQMKDKPLFCCVCGDLVHMTSEIYANEKLTREECDKIQDDQVRDFQGTWSKLNPDVALVCVCGNHDIGNAPTPTSIERFRMQFGDEYLAFWAKRCYNIVVNTCLFNDASKAPSHFKDQYTWLEERLQYATDKQAQQIFVFGHHPWFLYKEDEDGDTMEGYSTIANETKTVKVPDSYFILPKESRMKVLALFEKFNVSAAFSGHFHQNMVSTTSFGMQMIVTSSLSDVIESTGKPADFDEPNTRGIRVVRVEGGSTASFDHEFISL